MNHHRNKRNRGISLVEVVVAMMVITIVSAAAITTIKYSKNFTSRVVSYHDSRAVAINALENFKFCTNDTEFYDNLFRCGDFTRDYAESNAEWTVYMFTAPACVTRVYVRYPAMKVVCTDSAGDIVFQFEFTKTD